MCHTTGLLHKHHVFGAANRRWSEKYGLWVYLCPAHHNMSDAGVHFNKHMDTQLKQIAQREFEDTYGHDKFVKVFGKNYL
jgi:hypothetical protein